MSRFLACLIAAVLVSGCADRDGTVRRAAPGDSYAAYIELVREQQKLEQDRFLSLAQAATACQGDARCVETVVGYAAVAQAAASGQGSGARVAPPPPSGPSALEQFTGLVGALSPIAQAGIGYYGQRQATRASVETTRLLWDGIGRIFEAATPSITVGGDYVPGLQHHGDSVGRDYISGHQGDAIGRDRIGRDQHIGDHAGRDIIGGDRIGRGARIGSPDIDESGDCRDGADCSQPQPPPGDPPP